MAFIIPLTFILASILDDNSTINGNHGLVAVSLPMYKALDFNPLSNARSLLNLLE